MNISKIVTYFLSFVIAIFPWLMFNGLIDEIEPIKNILLFFALLVLTILFLIKAIQRKEFKFLKTPFDIPILLVCSITILATILSINPLTSVFGLDNRFTGGLLSVLGLIAIYFLIVNLIEKENEIKLLSKVYVYSVSLLAFVGFLKILGVLDPIFLELTKVGIITQNISSGLLITVGTYDQLVLLFLITIPLVYQMLAGSKKPLSIVVNLLCLISLLVTFIAISFLTFPLISSVGGLLILAVVLVMLTFKSKILWKEGKLPLLVVIIGVMVVTGLIFGLPGLGKSIGLNPNFFRPPELMFTDAWYISTKTWTELPIKGLIVGSGPDTYVYAYNLFKPNGLATSEFNKSTTYLLDTMSNTGLVGLIAFVVFVLYLIRFVLKKLPKDNVDIDNTYLFGFTTSVIVYFISTLFYNPAITVQFTFWLFLALLASSYIILNKFQTEEYSLSFKFTRIKLTEERSIEILPILSVVVIVFLMLVGFVAIAISFTSNLKFKEALESELAAVRFFQENNGELKTQETKKKLIEYYKQAYEKTLNANNLFPRDMYLRKMGIYASNVVVIHQKKVDDSTEAVLSDNEANAYFIVSKDTIDQSYRLNPVNYQNFESGAGIFYQYYLQNLSSIQSSYKEGDEKISIENVPFYKESLESATKTLQLNPTRIEAKLILSRILSTVPSTEAQTKAREQLIDAYSLDRSNLTTISLLGQYFEASKDYSNALELYKTTRDNFVEKDSENYKNLDARVKNMEQKVEEAKQETK